MTGPVPAATPGVAEATVAPTPVDPFSRSVARGATGLLAELNRAEVLAVADVHTARRLGRLAACEDERVLLALALAVRAVRLGAVCQSLTDLDGVDAAVGPAVAWPDPDDWRAALVAADRLVRVVPEDGALGEVAADDARPLVLDGDLVYLDRYWREEGQVVADLHARESSAPPVAAGLEESLVRYFGDSFREQREAAAAAATGWTTVVTGGPGTGKTTTIARLLGVLLDGDPALRIALAAPTGRAAARLQQAVRDATANRDFPSEHRARIQALTASTLHRLLGSIPGRSSRFRHDRTNRLPYDVVVVDETSMVSLTMTARLLEAVRPGARLVLVGDPDQLASVDAGAVLGDLVVGLRGEGRAGRVATLTERHRFGDEIGALADAIRAGDARDVVERLKAGSESGAIALEEQDEAEARVLAHARTLRGHAERGDVAAALQAMDAHRLLCAHREGPAGANTWNRRVERSLAAETRGNGLTPWYVGRPLLVTANDYGLELFNGDTGVVVHDDAAPGKLRAHVATGVPGESRPFAVGRLSEVQSAHAMTVHRSQGSQVQEVTVLLPEDASQLLTQQLLYTAVTRATERVRVVGTEDAVRDAVTHRALRASGLADRLTRKA